MRTSAKPCCGPPTASLLRRLVSALAIRLHFITKGFTNAMRQSGILLHITSLPSPGGIGTLGKEAYAFVDFLHDAGMRIWQVLPVSPTGFGDSPYQSVSTYAGNPLMIDLPMLEKEAILPNGIAPLVSKTEDAVDYGMVYTYKMSVLRKAFAHAHSKLSGALARFQAEHPWVEDYALFSAVKEHFGMLSWMAWPDEAIRMRKKEAMAAYKEQLADLTAFYVFIQYLFFRQWMRLKSYANRKGVLIFGDMPIYVAEDSADVWTSPEVFLLDETRRPISVAGVPPDFFSRDGQRWGNPLYNWAYLAQTRYAWWIDRLSAAGMLYDIVRIDHFIGFANYYAIPASETTARNGVWKRGPGKPFLRAVKKQLPDLRIVAEDLGAVNKRVLDLMRYAGYPGMKILTFAFGGNPGSTHLPQNYEANSVVYTGTHDNSTARGWYEATSEAERAFARKMLHLKPEDDLPKALVRAALISVANTAVIPMQDILGLPDTARMNIPGTVGGNWLWRMRSGLLTDELSGKLRSLNILSGRATS